MSHTVAPHNMWRRLLFLDIRARLMLSGCFTRLKSFVANSWHNNSHPAPKCLWLEARVSCEHRLCLNVRVCGDAALLIRTTWEEKLWRGEANHIDTAVLGWHLEAAALSQLAGTNRQTKRTRIHPPPRTFHLLPWQLPFRGGRAPLQEKLYWVMGNHSQYKHMD